MVEGEWSGTFCINFNQAFFQTHPSGSISSSQGAITHLQTHIFEEGFVVGRGLIDFLTVVLLNSVRILGFSSSSHIQFGHSPVFILRGHPFGAMQIQSENRGQVKRKMEEIKIMSICFTWFPIGGYRRTQYITSIGLNFNVWGVFWRVSDCEELVGVTHRR